MFNKKLIPLLIVNIISIVGFTFFFLKNRNAEFMIYILVIILLAVLIYFTHKKVKYTNSLLWLLTVWSILHMAGGGIIIKGKTLYATMLIPLIGEPYLILKYDQFVHAFGFFVATLVMFHILKHNFKKDFGWTSVLIVIIFAGLGLGALNEIIEFIATVIVPNTGVGGYVNTALDLVFNLIGAIIAGLLIYSRRKNLVLDF